MMKKVAIFLMVIMCVFVMGACDRKISYRSIQSNNSTYWSNKSVSHTELITSYEELLSFTDDSEAIENYDENFFNENALVVVGFPTSHMGGFFEDIHLTRTSDYLKITYKFYEGSATALGYARLTLIVSQKSVKGCSYVINNAIRN